MDTILFLLKYYEKLRHHSIRTLTLAIGNALIFEYTYPLEFVCKLIWSTVYAKEVSSFEQKSKQIMISGQHL